MKKKLTNLSTRYQVLLEGLKTDKAQKLVKSLRPFFNKVDSVLSKIEGEKLNDIGFRALRSVTKELEAQLTPIIEKAVKDFKTDFAEIGSDAASFEAKVITTLTKLKVAIPEAKVAYATALARPLSATGDLLEAFVDNWGSGEVLRINNMVRKAYAEGWSVQQMKQAIRGTSALEYKDGIVATTSRNAETVARTSIQHVANVGRMSFWEANEDIVEGYKIVATLDGRTSSICRSLDGKIFKLDKGPIPPLHPNCRSTTVVELKDKSLDFLDEGATRASKDGQVSANLTYYDWLKKQPLKFQDKVLGPTRGKLLREGGLTSDQFAKLNLNRNFQPMTLEEMRASMPLAFEEAGLE